MQINRRMLENAKAAGYCVHGGQAGRKEPPPSMAGYSQDSFLPASIRALVE